MGINSFWLFYVETDSILVALINWGNGRFYVASIGPRVECDINNPKSLVKAADESLSSAATSADISPDQEPIFVGLVIPSSWVGEDGKIIKSKSDVILPLLKDLDLKPSGFMSNDEAIIEESNQPDDFPASFITIYIENSSFDLSLIYLGKIKKHLKKFFDGKFTPQLIEDSLLELNSDSALPPQIYLYGKIDDSIVGDFKNFPWIGKKNIETFLHLPDIKFYQDQDLINIFFRAITSQMLGGSGSTHQSLPPAHIPPTEESVEEISEEIEETKEESAEEIVEESIPKEDIENISDLPEPESADIPPLTEVSFQDLGFTQDHESVELVETIKTEPIPVISEPEPQLPPAAKKLPQLKLPKIKVKLPKLKFNIFVLIFPLIIIILAAPLFLTSAQISLFLTPYEFNKTTNITLDSQAAELTATVIPVDQKTITINSSITIKTTGQKTVGEKATGEITIFNKQEKVQNLSKGSIVTDSKGQKFELVNSVQIAASTSNFDTGTMNFGQAKTTISATDIGTEYNISKDSTLSFKDFSDNILVIKINSDFTGGTKQQIAAVSPQDKINAESQLAQKLKDEASQKIDEEFNSSNDVIKETLQTKKGKTELSREVGEEADELTASAQSTVSVLALKPELKEQIIDQLLSSEKGFSDSDPVFNSFTFNFSINKISSDKATGNLIIQGKSLPKIDMNSIQEKLSGKTYQKAESILKNYPRVYNYRINLNRLNLFKILPLNSKNILIDIKSESL